MMNRSEFRVCYRWALVLGLLDPASLLGQIALGGSPLGLSEAALLQQGPVIVLPAVDVQALLAEDEQNRSSSRKGPYRFGYDHLVDLASDTHGTWTTLPNGDRVWQLTINCPQALGINFVFDRYEVPPGARLFVYNPTGQQLGAFDATSSGGQKSMGVTQLPGERITIEYQEPAAAAGTGYLHIGQVTHGYRDAFKLARDLGDSGDCNINVICPEGDHWRNEIRSVVRITVGGGYCTGTLINNCAEDGTPYILTADHCVDANIANAIFLFNWNSPVCDPTENAPMGQTVSGCELLVNSPGTDVALLRLHTTPPEEYDVYYSGWDRTAVPATNATGIHHPAGDIKKISRTDGVLTQSTFDGAECWLVGVWNAGTTEQGSSGSGLWNQNKQLVGQLFGGAAECGNSVQDYYGRLDVSWPLLEPWLGANCGDTLGGWEADEIIPVVFDAAVTSITNIAELECGEDSISPVITLKNNGTVAMLDALITYAIQGAASNTHAWSGLLQPGQTVTIHLPAISVLPGENVLMVSSSIPNGSVDQVPENDTWTLMFNASVPVGVVNLILTLDSYGSDVTWKLTNASGTVLYDGGPYLDPPSGTVDSVAFCLTAGCYTFTINDFFGDGICCENGNGSYVIRDLYTTVFAESNGQYGDQDISEFCINGVGVNERVPDPWVVSPNPSGGLFVIDPGSLREEGSYVITDAMGRLVADGHMKATAKHLIDLSDEEPGIYLLRLEALGKRSTKRLVLTR